MQQARTALSLFALGATLLALGATLALAHPVEAAHQAGNSTSNTACGMQAGNGRPEPEARERISLLSILADELPSRFSNTPEGTYCVVTLKA